MPATQIQPQRLGQRHAQHQDTPCTVAVLSDSSFVEINRTAANLTIPWYQTLVGQAIRLPDSTRKAIGIIPRYEDRSIVDSADDVVQLARFGLREGLVKKTTVEKLLASRIGSHGQAQTASALFEGILDGLKRTLDDFQEALCPSMPVDKKQLDSYRQWAGEDFCWNLTISSSDPDEYMESDDHEIQLRLVNEIGGAMLSIPISQLPDDHWRLTQAACLLASILGELALKEITLPFLDEGYPWVDFLGELDAIALPDREKLLSMEDKTGHFDFLAIEGLLAQEYPEIAAEFEEWVGDEWGYAFIEALRRFETLEGDWRLDHLGTVPESLAILETLLPSLRQYYPGHRIVAYLDWANKQLAQHLSNDACLNSGALYHQVSDRLFTSKFVGFGLNEAENDLMESQNECAWNESAEMVTLDTTSPLLMAFLKNIALAEVLLCGLACVFPEL